MLRRLHAGMFMSTARALTVHSVARWGCFYPTVLIIHSTRIIPDKASFVAVQAHSRACAIAQEPLLAALYI